MSNKLKHGLHNLEHVLRLNGEVRRMYKMHPTICHIFQLFTEKGDVIGGEFETLEELVSWLGQCPETAVVCNFDEKILDRFKSMRFEL